MTSAQYSEDIAMYALVTKPERRPEHLLFGIGSTPEMAKQAMPADCNRDAVQVVACSYSLAVAFNNDPGHPRWTDATDPETWDYDGWTVVTLKSLKADVGADANERNLMADLVRNRGAYCVKNPVFEWEVDPGPSVADSSFAAKGGG